MKTVLHIPPFKYHRAYDSVSSIELGLSEVLSMVINQNGSSYYLVTTFNHRLLDEQHSTTETLGMTKSQYEKICEIVSDNRYF